MATRPPGPAPRSNQAEPTRAPKATRPRARARRAAPIPLMQLPAERTLTLTVPESLVRGWYQAARQAGDDPAALLLGDALLGGEQ